MPASVSNVRVLVIDDDAALRETLAERGRNYVKKTHTKERLVADIIAVYRESSDHRR